MVVPAPISNKPPPPPLPKHFTIVELIDSLGGPSAFARICGFNTNPHARGCDLRRRQSVAVRHWPDIMKAAHVSGYPQVSWESLAAAHQMPKIKPPKRKVRKGRRKSSMVS